MFANTTLPQAKASTFFRPCNLPAALSLVDNYSHIQPPEQSDAHKERMHTVIYKYGTYFVIYKYGTYFVIYKYGAYFVIYKYGTYFVIYKYGAYFVIYKYGTYFVIYKYGAYFVIYKYGPYFVIYKCGTYLSSINAKGVKKTHFKVKVPMRMSFFGKTQHFLPIR